MNQLIEKLAKISDKLDHWMRAEAWPLWWINGRHANGSFYEALDFSGRPVLRNGARLRVQARQIYSFALAWCLGWRDQSLPEGLAISLDRYMHTCIGPEGLPGLQVNIETGRMTDSQPNLYVTAFTLMALTQSREVIDDASHDLGITHLLDNIDRHLAYTDGSGYRETLPVDSARHQNPHMHFYESLLCLYAATGDSDVAKRAAVLFEFVSNTFFDHRNGVVREHVRADVVSDDQPYEPGHCMEWVWLMGYCSRLFNTPLDPFAIQLYTTYLSSGFPEGKTPMRLNLAHDPVDPTCRLWSQTEALKAHLCVMELGPDNLAGTALKRAVDCAESILEDWLSTDCKGGFYDHFDANGNLIAKEMPGSMGYHLYVAIMELSRFMRKRLGEESRG